MIWAIVFLGFAALSASDAWRSFRSGKFIFVPRFYGKAVPYDRRAAPRSFWFGIGAEIVAALLFTAAAITRISN